jgi:hypothetical protein
MSVVTVAPTVEPGNWPPRVRLDVTDTSIPLYQEVTVTRLDPNGRTATVRTPDGNPLTLTSSVGLVYDYEAPYGQPVTYSTVEDPATVSAQVTVDEDRIWLIHPGVPELSAPVELRSSSLLEEEWAVEQGVFFPQGREFPVVHTDGIRRAPSSSLTVAVDSLADLSRVRSLLRDASVLLLNVPAGLGLGFDTSYVAIGNVRNARVSDIGSDPKRAVTLPFVVVDRPSGGTQADRTYSDLLSYSTYADLQAAYTDYQAVLSGP